LIKVTTDLLTV